MWRWRDCFNGSSILSTTLTPTSPPSPSPSATTSRIYIAEPTFLTPRPTVHAGPRGYGGGPRLWTLCEMVGMGGARCALKSTAASAPASTSPTTATVFPRKT